ncbi:phenoloxidase-activating factor 2-like [Leptopilina heterotoma]|uniref:phenoloxidase-activating factor 2-like n=1 Tax=Leptopilina heterotoma TaxID=63436 RepID=UPI001CA840BB|nr:phenoloxidase-activating factor 2-like [Leptopilina heterotoma]
MSQAFASSDQKKVPPIKGKLDCRCISVNEKCDGFIFEKYHTLPFSIDIRIVNLGMSPVVCSMGEVNCCKNNLSPPSSSSKKCGERKIVSNGQKVDQAAYGAYPWHAEILNSDNKYLGGGVIIDDTHLITAAHIVANLKNNYKIRLGKYNRASQSEQFLEVKPVSTKVHEDFNSINLLNDIAIIRINQKILFDNFVNINAACLPTGIPPAGTVCWSAGWGKNNFTSNRYESILKAVDLPIVDPKTCEMQFRKTRLGADFNLDWKSFICAGGELGKDSCTGDGGGALICQPLDGRFEVVGLTAWGIGCGQKDVPAAYVHVYNYLDWINKNM